MVRTSEKKDKMLYKDAQNRAHKQKNLQNRRKMLDSKISSLFHRGLIFIHRFSNNKKQKGDNGNQEDGQVQKTSMFLAGHTSCDTSIIINKKEF